MILEFLKQVYQIWISERPVQLAAALAYYALFALAPVIFVAFTVAGLFIDNTALAQQAAARLEQVLGPEMVQVIQAMVANTSVDLPDSLEKWTWFSSIIGFLVLVWAASGLFYQIHFALNSVLRTSETPSIPSRGGIRQRLLSFSIVILLGLLLVIVAIANVLISWIDSILDVPNDYSLIIFLLFVVLTAACFAIIYRFIPNVQHRWRAVWLGASVAALLETIGLLLLGLFLQLGVFKSAAAAAGSIAVLLVLVYYMAQIFLLGAVITRVFSSRQAEKTVS